MIGIGEGVHFFFSPKTNNFLVMKTIRIHKIGLEPWIYSTDIQEYLNPGYTLQISRYT